MDTDRKKRVLLLPVVFLLLILVFFFGYKLGAGTESSAAALEWEQIVEKGQEAILPYLEEKEYACEILEIAYVPTAEEAFLLSMNSETDEYEKALQEGLEEREYIKMRVDWYEPHRQQSFRKYFIISAQTDKTVLEASTDIPLADGSVTVAQDAKACAAAEDALVKELTDSVPDIQIEGCQIDKEETERIIRSMAAMEQSLLRGWTKDFFETRFAVIHVKSHTPGEMTPEGEACIKERYYVMTREIAADRWASWEWYEEGETLPWRFFY